MVTEGRFVMFEKSEFNVCMNETYGYIFFIGTVSIPINRFDLLTHPPFINISTVRVIMFFYIKCVEMLHHWGRNP